ncbi:multidrug resistance efflux transporter [Cystoisospora suis]|uniref:Multidrug resistance efflux transporter n=1 Tax=Cystoisospora suis TaxID=483139 RepID=A0A2C6KHD2_9APIC|nr:multidrug resistance efflux transporter [Cystoisospora suis]
MFHEDINPVSGCDHAEPGPSVQPAVSHDSVPVGSDDPALFGVRLSHTRETESTRSMATPAIQGMRQLPCRPVRSDDLEITEPQDAFSRAESASLFPPLTKNPLLLHSYRDSSLSSIFSGVLCCIFNIALYLISGGISRLLQQERELQRHESLQYVCPVPLADPNSSSRPSGTPVGVKDEKPSPPCTSEGIESRTRVVVFNIPYFMSWFSQSLQACFLFFAVMAIKRRRARMERLGSVSDAGQSPDVLSRICHPAREVRGQNNSDEVHSSSFPNPGYGPHGSTVTCEGTADRMLHNLQEFPTLPTCKEARTSSETLSARLGAHVPRKASDEQDSSKECGKVAAAELLESKADDRRVRAPEGTPGVPAASPATGAAERIPGFSVASAQCDRLVHWVPSAEEGATTNSTATGSESAVREEQRPSPLRKEATGRRRHADRSAGKPLPWIADVDSLVTSEVHASSALTFWEVYGSCLEANAEGVSHPPERSESTNVVQTTNEDVNLSIEDSGLQAQSCETERRCPSSGIILLGRRASALIMEGIVLCKREILDRAWLVAIRPPFLKLVAEPFRRHIYVPYLAGTHALIREFVEVDVQYASLDQLVCACLWIGALYLLQSWTWTVAVGKDGMSVGTVTAIYNTNPVFVFLFTVCLYKEGADDCVQIIALILATVGVAIIAYHNEGEPTSTSGIALSVCCAAFSGLFEVVYKNYILNGKSNLPLAFIFLIVGIIGVLSLLFFWVPIAALHFFGFEVFPDSPPPPLLVFLLLFVCICSCFHTLILQISLLLLPSPILVALCSLLSLPAAAAADWLSGGGGGVGGIGSFFIASAFLLTAVNEWRIRDIERVSTYKRLHSFAEQHPEYHNTLRLLHEEHRKHRPLTRRRMPLADSAAGADRVSRQTSLESLAAGLVAHKQDEDVGAELQEVLCICRAVQDEKELRVPASPSDSYYPGAIAASDEQKHGVDDNGWERLQDLFQTDAGLLEPSS